MKLSGQREALLAGLQAVIGVVERRQTMPILSNLLLKAADNSLSMTATDLELELVTSVPVSVEQPGETTIPARKLLDICRGLPAESEVSIELQEQRARISAGRSRFMISTLPAVEFPFLEDIEDGQTLTVSQGTLKHLFDHTYFAMAHQDVRYYLNGLLLVMQPQRLRAVATDGHRLALSDVTLDTGVESAVQVIVPRKAITELQRVLDSSDAEITLTFSQNHLQIRLLDKRFTTKLIDGRFPDYERVIPDTGDKQLVGEREPIRQALARTAILSNEKFKGVRLSLDENRLRLQAQNPEHEEAEEELVVTYSDEPVDIGFNVNYLMEALAAMESEHFSLELTGPDSSGLLRGQDDPDSQYVVMPMRL